jgi:hypothetical protein
MADTTSKTTTAFAAVAGAQVEKTEDRYYCRTCACVDHADHIEATGSITCAECDSEDVITLAQRQREVRAEIEAEFAAADSEADARDSRVEQRVAA